MSSTSSIGSISAQLALQSNQAGSSRYQQNLTKVANLELPNLDHSFPKAKPTDPQLTRFYKLGLVPASFTLNEAQENLLRSLFNKWHLDNQISLIDLLGLEICEQFKKICGPAECKEAILEGFGTAMMKSYLHLIREESPIQGRQKYIDHYLDPKQNIEKKLKELFSQIKQDKKMGIEMKSFTPAMKSKLQEAVDKMMEPLSHTIDFFLYCFTSAYRLPLLCKKDCTYFVGSESLKEYNPESLAHLRCYASYLEILCDSMFKSRKVVLTPYPVGEITKQLAQPIENLLSLPGKIHALSKSMQELMDEFANDFRSANKGLLTHDQWLTKRGIVPFSANRKPKEEFVETLQLNRIYYFLGEVFLDDLHRIVEFQVLRGHYCNQYVPRTLLLNRLNTNIRLIEHDQMVRDNDPFRIKLSIELGKIFAPLLAVAPRVDNSFAECLKGAWDIAPEKLAWAKDGIAFFEKICITLSSERKAMMARLAEALPPEGRPLEDLQKIAFEECKILCRLALILRDASALMNRDDLGEDIHPSLADLIELEGIEPYLVKKPILAPSSIEPAHSALSVALPEAQQVAPVKPQPKAATSAASSSSSPVPQSPLAPEEFTIENRNLRRVLQKLQQAGFQIYRSRKHHVLKLRDGGASVIVPTHGDELKEGTLKNIVNQAREALGSPSPGK